MVVRMWPVPPSHEDDSTLRFRTFSLRRWISEDQRIRESEMTTHPHPRIHPYYRRYDRKYHVPYQSHLPAADQDRANPTTYLTRISTVICRIPLTNAPHEVRFPVASGGHPLVLPHVQESSGVDALQ